MQDSAEYQLATYNSGSPTAASLSTAWPSEAFLPVWPGGVQPSFWSITTVSFQASKSAAAGTYKLALYKADSSGKPVGFTSSSTSGSVASATINLADVSTTMGWIANPVTLNATGLNPNQKYCLVWRKEVGASGTFNVGVDTATTDTNFDYSTSALGTGPWNLNTARDAFFDVSGYYTTGVAAVDTTSSAVAVDGLTNPSGTIDVNSKTDRHLSVWLILRNVAGSPDVNDAVCTSMTFDGVPMTLMGDSGWGPTWERVLHYSLVAPNIGTGLTFAAELTGTYWNGEMLAVCSVNVNQTSPVATDPNAVLDTAYSVNIYTVQGRPKLQLGDLILDGLAWTGAATVNPTFNNSGTRTTVLNTNNSAASTVEISNPNIVGLNPMTWVTNSTDAAYAYLAVTLRGLDNAEPVPVRDYSNFPNLALRPPASDVSNNPDDGPSE